MASEFNIQVRFRSGLSNGQKAAFTTAAERWMKIVVGDLPTFRVGRDRIDDLLILAKGARIDGPEGILGSAGPTRLRPGTLLPALGEMEFDSADLAEMEANGTLLDVITHEMGHVLGIGTIWEAKGLLPGAGTDNPEFIGPQAMREFAALKRLAAPRPVPVENEGEVGDGTRDGHWRESVFRDELMTGFVGVRVNPLSRLTIASLADLGYAVSFDAADIFTLSASRGGAPTTLKPRMMVRRPEFTVLPDDAAV